MTAEIAILNNSGIALAADSAVTIGEQKVYNSANKLFTLSKYHPVGIMVYDSAALMGVPWEIIIKEFRAELGNSSYDTLDEYAQHFWKFLSEKSRIIPKSNKENYIAAQVYNYIDIIFKELEATAREEIKKQGKTSIRKTLEKFDDIIKQHCEIILEAGFADEMNEDVAKSFLESRKETLTELASRQLGKLYSGLTEESQSKLLTLISNVFIRDRFILRSSGVVIAGYGRSEMFPKITTHTVEGIFDGKIRKIFQKGKSNVQDDSFLTTIIPFAQDEMVWTFITGVDPEVVSFADKYLREIFRKYPEKIDNNELGLDEERYKSLKGQLRKGGEQLFDDFNRELSSFQRSNNTQPILDMVGVLPKDELAAMAESLVNLTVFKRKVSKAVETVGGPIDVAIISKGDGFIWVKRKHYFKPELNPHYFTNYFRKEADND